MKHLLSLAIVLVVAVQASAQLAEQKYIDDLAHNRLSGITERAAVESLRPLVEHQSVVKDAIATLKKENIPGVSNKTKAIACGFLEDVFANSKIIVNYYDMNNGSMAGFSSSYSGKAVKLNSQRAGDRLKDLDMEEWRAYVRWTALQTRPVGANGWRCNYQKAFHTNPEDCQHPEMGGVWE